MIAVESVWIVGWTDHTLLFITYFNAWLNSIYHYSFSLVLEQLKQRGLIVTSTFLQSYFMDLHMVCLQKGHPVCCDYYVKYVLSSVNKINQTWGICNFCLNLLIHYQVLLIFLHLSFAHLFIWAFWVVGGIIFHLILSFLCLTCF